MAIDGKRLTAYTKLSSCRCFAIEQFAGEKSALHSGKLEVIATKWVKKHGHTALTVSTIARL